MIIYNIGEVGFARRDPEGRLVRTIHIGPQRVALLKAAIRGDLPPDLVLIGDRDGGGFEPIEASQISKDAIEYYKLRES